MPPNLAARIEDAVGRPGPTDPSFRDLWEEEIAGVLVGLYVGQIHAPLRNAYRPKHSGERDGPAKRVKTAIAALQDAAAALDRLPFMIDTPTPASYLSALNRDAAKALADTKGNVPRGRPTNAIQKRAVTRLLRLYILGFANVPRRTSGKSPFRRFIEATWHIAVTDCGMNPKVIGSQSAAWSAADHLLRRLTAQRQKDVEIG